MMADSGGAVPPAQISSVCRHARPDAKRTARFIETPITANFREGLNVTAVLHLDHGARKACGYRAQDGQLRLPDSCLSTWRRLVYRDRLRHDQRFVDTPIVEGGDVVEGLGERVWGRVVPKMSWRRPAARCW